MTAVMIHLKTYNILPEVRGIPGEWYGQNNYQREREAEQGNRDKCKQDWDNQSTYKEEERWKYARGSKEDDEMKQGRREEEP